MTLRFSYPSSGESIHDKETVQDLERVTFQQSVFRFTDPVDQGVMGERKLIFPN